MCVCVCVCCVAVRDDRELEQTVSSGSAENWSNCGHKGMANKICWYIRCSGKQSEVKIPRFWTGQLEACDWHLLKWRNGHVLRGVQEFGCWPL